MLVLLGVPNPYGDARLCMVVLDRCLCTVCDVASLHDRKQGMA